MSENMRTTESIACDRQEGIIQKVVFVSGVFNILHPGHFRLLRFAKECGDCLIVGVLADNKTTGALISESERLQAVLSIGWVDHALMVNQSIKDIIAEIRPDIVVKGGEHENGFNPEMGVLDSYGGKIIYCSGETTFSSLDLIKSEINQINYSTINKPKDYLERHGLTLGNLHDSLDFFNNVNVCVIGDSIVDEYATCDPVGMSQEDPTLVVTPVTNEKFVGGAAIVASHASCLGSSVRYISVVGDDDAGKFVNNKLHEFDVSSHLTSDKSRPTTTKTRYRASGKTLLRVNNFRQHHISLEIQNAIIEYIKAHIENIDLLIFSDFNYGVLPQSLVDKISEICEYNDVFMVADSQCSSQIGDISRYSNMMLLTPTEREARLATRDFESGLVIMTEELRKKTNSNNIIVTMGAEGLLIHAGSDDGGWETDQLPAFNSSPKDPAGAGDVFLVCTAIIMSKGRTIWEAAYIGALAAACQVGRIGNIPITLNELRQELLD